MTEQPPRPIEGRVTGLPAALLRTEGFVLDVSMLGYLAGPRIGAVAYNLFHTYFFPAAISLVGMVAGEDLLYSIGLIWFAHIGADRLLGYGLKYPTGFRRTHLSS